MRPTTRRSTGDASGYVALRWQPGVIRHTLVGKRDHRTVQISLQRGDLRIAIEVPDPAALVVELQSAIEWVADPEVD